MSNETLRETLLFQPKHGYERLTPAQKEEMESYCKDYAAFMDAAKTEREAVTYTVAAAEKAGFRPLTPGMTLKAGDKVYRNNRGKSILLAHHWRREPERRHEHLRRSHRQPPAGHQAQSPV